MFLYKMSFRAFVKKVIGRRQDVYFDIDSSEIENPKYSKLRKIQEHRPFQKHYKSETISPAGSNSELLNCEYCKNKDTTSQQVEEVPIIVVQRDSPVGGAMVNRSFQI